MQQNKRFTVKIYDTDGTTIIKTLQPSVIKNVPSFTSQINGGFGQCVLDLNLPFDDFGEGSDIDFMYIAKIYVGDMANPLGRLVYTGFISAYQPYIEASRSGVKVTLLGMVSLLSFAYYKNGSSYTVAHVTDDPADIMKAIVDHFNGVYAGNFIGYDSGSTTVDTVGVNVTYTFTEKKWLDALKDTFKLVSPGWWWVVDKAGQLYLKEKPTTATHRFTIGKDVESITVDKSAENVRNKVRVKYNGNVADDDDATSISRFGTREAIVSQDQVQNGATASQLATQEVDNNKVEKIKAKVVINLNYDLESIQVGDTCKILNLDVDQQTFNDNMQIVSVAYNFDKVTIELEEQTKFSIELQKFIA